MKPFDLNLALKGHKLITKDSKNKNLTIKAVDFTKSRGVDCMLEVAIGDANTYFYLDGRYLFSDSINFELFMQEDSDLDEKTMEEKEDDVEENIDLKNEFREIINELKNAQKKLNDELSNVLKDDENLKKENIGLEEKVGKLEHEKDFANNKKIEITTEKYNYPVFSDTHQKLINDFNGLHDQYKLAIDRRLEACNEIFKLEKENTELKKEIKELIKQKGNLIVELIKTQIENGNTEES